MVWLSAVSNRLRGVCDIEASSGQTVAPSPSVACVSAGTKTDKPMQGSDNNPRQKFR